MTNQPSRHGHAKLWCRCEGTDGMWERMFGGERRVQLTNYKTPGHPLQWVNSKKVALFLSNCTRVQVCFSGSTYVYVRIVRMIIVEARIGASISRVAKKMFKNDPQVTIQLHIILFP